MARSSKSKVETLTGAAAPPGVAVMVSDARTTAEASPARERRAFYVNGEEVSEAEFRAAVEERGQFRPGNYPASRAINLHR